jgi:hypothetical protein
LNVHIHHYFAVPKGSVAYSDAGELPPASETV